MLESKLNPGESLLYETTTYVVLDLPQPKERLVGKTVTQQLVSVIEARKDGWVLLTQQRITEVEGPLASPGDMTFEPLRYRVDKAGNGYHLETGDVVSQASMPQEAVDLGDSWTVGDTKFMVESVEIENGDTVITLVGQAQSADKTGARGDGPSRTVVASRVAFGADSGCTLRSKVATSTTWTSGRKLETVVDMSLKDRGKKLHAG